MTTTPEWLKPTQSAASRALAEIERREAHFESLAQFSRTFVEVEPALHHRVICENVDDLMDDEFDVLVIMSPPASAKSTYISVAAPAYIIGRNPREQIISVSRAAELAADFGGKVKNIVESDLFGSYTGVKIDQNTRAKDNWKTTAGGGYFAVGASGGVLGKRASVVICLTKNNYLRTRTGYTSISNIKLGDEVEAYDTEKLSTGYYRVIDTGWRDTDDIYRIHTADGRVVESTGNHPFFVGGKFVPAMALAVGDVLLSSVRYPCDEKCAGTRQAGAEGQDRVLLQSELFNTTYEHSREGVCDPQDVQQLWKAIHDEGTRQARCAGLLGGLSQRGQAEGGDETAKEHGGSSMCSLRNCVFEKNEDQHLLLAGVQKQSAPVENECDRESGLPSRQSQGEVSGRQRDGVQACAKVRYVSGQSGMCDLHQHGESARSSCGFGQDEQCPDQHRDTLPEVSFDPAWCGEGKTFETTVARVERVCANERVWDIKVEGVANFFANGILVHNCDDVHASFEDAQSETQLQKLRNWFESDLLSRLTPTGKLIVIGQRLNANDIIGYILQRSTDNPDIRLRVLKFTAVADDTVSPEHPDLLGRTTPDERMWPEFYTDAYLNDKRRDDFIWRTLWMQEPPSESGSWVAPDEVQMLDTMPATTTRYLCSDLALSVNKGDYSVHITCAVTPDGGLVIEDAWRGRTSVEVTVERHLDLIEQYMMTPAPVMESLIDDDNASKVYVQLLASRARERGIPVPFKPLPLRGQDKETRAAPLRGWFKRRKVFMLRAEWNRWLVTELMAFPNAMGSGVDDGVDALSLMGRRLMALAKPADPAATSSPTGTSKTVLQATLNEMWEDHDRRRGRGFGSPRI